MNTLSGEAIETKTMGKSLSSTWLEARLCLPWPTKPFVHMQNSSDLGFYRI